MSEDAQADMVPRYRAFISYSHADARFATWLHRKLEGFKVPIRGPGETASSLSPVFIDRAELAAAPDLTATVQAAIANSGALVVVCSPAGKASQWVAQEIELFRSIHPDRPILAALIAGEPAEAFPQPLVEHEGAAIEPLAADFRKGHDGPRLGLLKIIAGLTGQPLDQLVRRDEKKRQARVMAVTAAAAALIVVLSTLLVIAVRARAEAERQRAEAEGMVEFMLTDLREKLKGVGRLDVMDSVNQRAMKHYAAQDLSALPDDSLTRRARLLHAMGEDDEARSAYAQAAQKYREAHRATAQVLSKNPGNPDVIFAHAQSEYWVGAIEWTMRRFENAGAPWRGYLVQAEALARVEPNTVRSNMELGYAHGNLCEFEMKMMEVGKTPTLTRLPEHCTLALAFEEKALALKPGDPEIQLEMANRTGWLASHLQKLGRDQESLAYRDREAAMIDALIKLDPKNLKYRYRREAPEQNAGIHLVQLGRYREGYERLRANAERLAQLDAEAPGNTLVLRMHTRALYWIAKASVDAGMSDAKARFGEALAAYRRNRHLLVPDQQKSFERYFAQLEGEMKR